MTDAYKTTKAVTLTARKDFESLQLLDFPVQDLKPDEILIQNVAVAQNPIDWKSIAFDFYIEDIPWTNGHDIAGTVVRVGSAVTKFKPGDRVISFLTNQSPRHASYQTLPIGLESLTVHLPEAYTFEQGSTIPSCFVTAACGFYDALKIPLTDTTPKNEPFLVWGGSSSLGGFVIQLAKAAGYTVIATASQANHDYVKSLGASHAFDYHSPDVVQQIRAAAGPNLRISFDAISAKESIEGASASITAENGGKIIYVVPFPEEVSTKVKKQHANVELVYTTGLLAVSKPDIRENVFRALGAFVESGKLVPTPAKVLPGGLKSVKEGLLEGMALKLSAEKIVYRIAETET